MKNLNILKPLSGGTPAARFEAARAMAFAYALADSELLEPELVAWCDRTTSMASPVLEGCSGPYGWRDYGISHAWTVAGKPYLFLQSPVPTILASISVPELSSISAMPKATR